jgi:hypothetical protein
MFQMNVTCVNVFMCATVVFMLIVSHVHSLRYDIQLCLCVHHWYTERLSCVYVNERLCLCEPRMLSCSCLHLYRRVRPVYISVYSLSQ